MFVLSANGEMTSTEDFDDDSSVISFENAESTEWRCAACGSFLVEESGGYAAESGSRTCSDYDPADDPGHGVDTCPDVGEGRHQPQRIPLSWANGAAIHTDPDGDSITVMISVGDPRGAFTFTVRRVPDDVDDNAGRLILHTPYPGEPMPHVELVEDHAGTYWVA